MSINLVSLAAANDVFRAGSLDGSCSGINSGIVPCVAWTMLFLSPLLLLALLVSCLAYWWSRRATHKKMVKYESKKTKLLYLILIAPVNALITYSFLVILLRNLYPDAVLLIIPTAIAAVQGLISYLLFRTK